jgi:uncharacterized protein
MLQPRVAVFMLLAGQLWAAGRPDLIVVGGGIAGLSAALEGARAGLQVTVVELNTVPGGHAVISSGGLLLVATPLQERSGIADSPELAERDFLRWGEDADQDWVRYYTRNSKTEIHDWMTALGTEFTGVSVNGAGSSVARFHMPRQQGIGLVLPVFREILRQGGVTMLYGHRVTGLILRDGRVAGVRAEVLREGKTVEIEGTSVLVSTGGFGSDLDLVRSSWPKGLPLPERILAGGGFFADGAGMHLAREAGGVSSGLDHQWNYATGLPDPFDPKGERGHFTVAPAAIWVNAQGKRFAREQHEPKVTIPLVAAQKPARFWTVFDAEGRKSFRIIHAGYGIDRLEAVLNYPGLIAKGQTLAELASSAGLPPAELEATVERYNAMAEAGEDRDFGRFHGGGAPPKSPRPPFYAAPMFILIRKSMGGIRVDESCRVLNAEGRPVPGLYAAGEATGFGGVNGRNGMEGAFLGPAILMGRVAAQTVAKAAGSKPAGPPTGTLRTEPPAADARMNNACRACHNVAKLVEAKRPGYWHFENSHRRVLARKFACTMCHAEMAPYRRETHKMDRHLQLNGCQHCHTNPAPGGSVAGGK